MFVALLRMELWDATSLTMIHMTGSALSRVSTISGRTLGGDTMGILSADLQLVKDVSCFCMVFLSVSEMDHH